MFNYHSVTPPGSFVRMQGSVAKKEKHVIGIASYIKKPSK